MLKQLEQRLKNHKLSKEECHVAARAIIDNNMEVIALPTMHSVTRMKRIDLIKVLRYCPESEWFHESLGDLYAMKKAQIKELVKRTISGAQLIDVIEVESKDE